MPVSFSSPPRNLFLLGSSGADVVTNFFTAVNTSLSGQLNDVFIPDEIRFGELSYTPTNFSGRYYTAGTAQDNNSKKLGWVESYNYYEEYPPNANPPNPPANVAQNREFFINTDTSTSIDTSLRAMELTGSHPNHELIVVGKTGSVPWIAKYPQNGPIQWVSTSNTADVEYTGVCKNGTNYYVCGSTAVSGDAVSFVEKFDSNGNPDWGKSATMLGRDVVLEKISVNSRDEIIAVGYLEDDTADKGYIVKINGATGEILWDRSLERNISGSGGTGDNNDEIASADVRCTACYIDGNDQIYVVGSIDGRSPVNNGVGEFLIKYSPEGNILWQRENHTDHYTALDGAPNMIPFDVKSDTDTQQTVVLSVENQGSFASNNSDIFLSKYSKDGTLVFRRKISKGSNTLGNASLDADPSFYYVLFTDQQTVPISGTPDRYFFGRVSTSGNGLGDFQYDDGAAGGTTPIDYTIVSNENKIGRLSDGSVRNDTSDFVTYPFTANKLVFDDLATPVSNKKKQMDGADSFEYGGSPAIRSADNPILSIGSQEKTVTTTSGSAVQGQQAYTNPGSYTWTAPANVTSVCVVCVGAGGAGGGALAYKNDITVVPGNSYNVVVGAPGSMGTGTTGSGAGQNTGTSGGNSTFQATHGTTVAQGGITGSPDVNDPKGSPAGDYDGGGNGGITFNYGGYSGGGAGGYSGDGGGAGPSDPSSGVARPGSGGGGGAGSWAYNSGGGVGINGEGASGAGNTNGDGFGGSGGQNGQGEGSDGGQVRVGGNYGGGASGRWAGNTGGEGAVRIIWGSGRAFPSTLTADVTPSSGPTTTTTTTLIDMSGNGNDGVVNGATITKYAGLSYNYLEFDGSNDYIQLPTNSDLTFAGDFSYETWLWTDVQPASNHIWSTPGDQTFQFNGGNIIYYSTITGGQSFGPLPNNTWAHYVITKSGNTLTGYLNGAQIWTNTPAGNLTHDFSGLSIGYRTIGTTGFYWDGRMGEIRIYPRALTEAAVFQNYNATKSKYTNQASTIGVKIGDYIKYNGLILHYDFNNKYTYDPSANLIFPSNIGQLMLNDASNVSMSIDYSIKDPFGEYGGVLKCEHASTASGYFRRGRNTPLTAGKTYTLSLYFKNGTISGAWEGRNTTNGPAFSCATFSPTFEAPMQTFDKNTPVGNGWYKQIFTFTPQYSQTYQAGFSISQGQAPLGIWYLAGFQFEEADTDGRFIPTNLSEVPRSNIVRNLSSSSFNGTVDGCTFNSDGYFEFDGVNDKIDIPHSSNMAFTNSLISIEAWVYIDNLVNGGIEFSIINKRGNNSTQNNNRPYVFGVNGDGRIRWILDGASTLCDSAVGLIQTGQWYHLVGTHDGTDAKIYVNNVLDTTVSSGTTSFADTGNVPTRIGYRYRNSDVNYSDGRIGELRMYNRALSQAEVSVNYLFTKSKYGL